MNYRLGTLPLRPDLGHLIRAFTAERRSPASPGGLLDHRDLLRRLESIERDCRSAPDLLHELRGDPGPDDWVFELAAALAGRAGLELTQCERADGPGGYLAIAVHDRSLAAAVRPGDDVCAGLAAVRGPDGGVEVLPRVYRKVCANGAIVFAHAGGDVLPQCGSVPEAVRLCLSPTTAGASFAILQAAARTPVADPLALLRAAQVPVPAAEVWAAREDADGSLFGVVNALTARARAEPRFDRRLELERGALRMLAGIAPGPRPRPRSVATAAEPIGCAR